MFLSGVDTLAKAKPKVAMIEDDDAEPAAALCDGVFQSRKPELYPKVDDDATIVVK